MSRMNWDRVRRDEPNIRADRVGLPHDPERQQALGLGFEFAVTEGRQGRRARNRRAAAARSELRLRRRLAPDFATALRDAGRQGALATRWPEVVFDEVDGWLALRIGSARGSQVDGLVALRAELRSCRRSSLVTPSRVAALAEHADAIPWQLRLRLIDAMELRIRPGAKRAAASPAGPLPAGRNPDRPVAVAPRPARSSIEGRPAGLSPVAHVRLLALLSAAHGRGPTSHEVHSLATSAVRSALNQPGVTNAIIKKAMKAAPSTVIDGKVHETKLLNLLAAVTPRTATVRKAVQKRGPSKKEGRPRKQGPPKRKKPKFRPPPTQ